MGGFDGIGGSSAKTDRSTTLGGYGDLNNLFKQGFSSGSNNVAAGSAGLGAAGNFYNTALSGNRQAVTSLMAPQIAQVNSGQDATRRGIAASGTSRGGGSASAGQQAHTQAQSLIDTSLLGARGQAAQGATQVGAAQMAGGSNLLNTAGNAAQDVTADSINSRPESIKANADMQKQVAASIGAIIQAFA